MKKRAENLGEAIRMMVTPKAKRKPKTKKREPRSVVYITEEEWPDGIWRPLTDWEGRRSAAVDVKRQWDEAVPDSKHRVMPYERRSK